MKLYHRRWITVLLTAAVFSVSACAGGEGIPERTITVCTQVTKWGQMPLSFDIRGQELPEGIGPEDFGISGEAAAWGTKDTHPFTCSVKDTVRREDGWSLIPEQFPDKYFYVQNLSVHCENAPELDFTLGEIQQTTTETADLFSWRETENHTVKAWVFEPETREPVPLVLVFHGYGDTQNLLTYRTAVFWAEEAWQKDHPCVVMAPVIDDGLYISDAARSKTFLQLLEWAEELIAAGKVDPDRIYAMGNSFGGMSAIEIAKQHPDQIAAVLALCPALNYSRTAMAGLAKMRDIPVYFAHAENDETISSSVSVQAAAGLEKTGNQTVQIHVYTDEEMTESGAVHGYEQTYSFHHVELAALEESSGIPSWLFSQAKQHVSQ